MRAAIPLARVGLAISALLLAGAPEARGGGAAHARLSARGTYENLQIGSGQGSTVQFAGPGYGGALELVVASKKASSSLGIGLAVDVSNLDNRANTAARSETLSTRNVQVSPRLYVSNLFVGIGARFSFLTLDSTVSGAATRTRYLLYGGRLEAGLHFALGETIAIQPELHYDVLKMSGSDGSGLRSATGMSGALGLAITF